MMNAECRIEDEGAGPLRFHSAFIILHSALPLPPPLPSPGVPGEGEGHAGILTCDCTGITQGRCSPRTPRECILRILHRVHVSQWRGRTMHYIAPIPIILGVV